MIILITAFALILIVALSVQLKRDREANARVRSLLVRANVAIERLQAQEPAKEDSKNFFDLV